MFRNTFQQRFVTIFNSIGSNPLAIWNTAISDGTCRRLTDEDINSSAFDLSSTHASTTFITAPAKPHESLSIKLPFIVLLVKNMNKYFTFEIQIMDDSNCLRRFRLSNFQSKTCVNMFSAQMPLALQPGWNVLKLNLTDFTRRAYGTNYIETVGVQLHANVRVRRIYFTDRLYEDYDKPRFANILVDNHIYTTTKHARERIFSRNFSMNTIVETITSGALLDGNLNCHVIKSNKNYMVVEFVSAFNTKIVTIYRYKRKY